MTEWGVVGVLIALVGFGATIIRPLLSLNTSIVRLTTQINQMTDSLDDISEKNHRSHERIWAHNEEQDDRLENHEIRLNTLEQRSER